MQKQTVDLLKSLAHPTRLEIVGALLGRGEVTCQELSKRFDLAQPTMSHHFNKLVDAGVLTNRREGTLWHYRLNESFLSDQGIHVDRLVSTNHLS